jgi:hypothetical protein
MNTFFLSLIQPDREIRRKNLACDYNITGKVYFGLKQRFPFLQAGDYNCISSERMGRGDYRHKYKKRLFLTFY